MTFKLSDRSRENMNGVDRRLVAIAEMAISISPIDFGIPQDGGVRTAERQFELFKAGKSKCDGFNKKSEHQSGLALDFYAFVDGKASWDREHLAIVAAAFLQSASMLGYKLNWGGLWKGFVDMPHVQLANK
jgi:peptidoglycan L-alanyl-D-glutamate endopeptidase CwlK